MVYNGMQWGEVLPNSIPVLARQEKPAEQLIFITRRLDPFFGTQLRQIIALISAT